ncbi:MAG TPA: neutral/alkaline non-lysosomal ceramidase N-terminal domain-containing protein, partial [Polyangiaceae bacterium]|nr:neutral/alkaline non-lysosomal ceramidase N-terminal domain-containing protein [Polyangiaceae bacterium]
FPAFLRGASTGPTAFPSVLPFSVVRIGDEAITFVPAEMTVAAGKMVKAKVQARLQARGVAHAVIAGLSNAYIQYVTTPEEYGVQGYEGASTLFGPQSAPLVADVADTLAARLYDGSASLPAGIDRAFDHEYFTGPRRDRLPQGSGDPTLEDLAGQRGAVATCSLPYAHPAAVCFLWTDGAPGVVTIDHGPWVGLVSARSGSAPALPGAAVLDGRLLDDRGVGFRTRVHRAVGDAWLWSTLFRPYRLARPPIADWTALAGLGPVSLRAGVGTPYEVASAPFSASQLPPPCTEERQRLCGE